MNDPDLTSLVLTLAPAAPLTTSAYLGRASYALLLRLVAAHDPELAEAIHNGEGSKPVTCSTLVGGRRQDRESRLYEPDKPAWLRFNGLRRDVSDHLRRLAANPPLKVELDGHIFQVRQATVDGESHPWAGQVSYEELGAPFLLAGEGPQYRLSLQFASPTTFRSKNFTQPVPMPGSVFGSLLKRWNAFSPVTLPEEAGRFAHECVALSRYQLRTRAFLFKPEVVRMGCVGYAEYVIVNRDRYWASMLNLLARFAFYSGVGYQTTSGMGQARPGKRPDRRELEEEKS